MSDIEEQRIQKVRYESEIHALRRRIRQLEEFIDQASYDYSRDEARAEELLYPNRSSK